MISYLRSAGPVDPGGGCSRGRGGSREVGDHATGGGPGRGGVRAEADVGHGGAAVNDPVAARPGRGSRDVDGLALRPNLADRFFFGFPLAYPEKLEGL